jgi:hypothetical protein
VTLKDSGLPNRSVNALVARFGEEAQTWDRARLRSAIAAGYPDVPIHIAAYYIRGIGRQAASVIAAWLTSGPANDAARQNHGGPAFPVPMVSDGNAVGEVNQHGMFLRDYFAAKAIPLTLSASAAHDGCYDYVAAAIGAYLVADAMLAAREPKS